MIDRTIQELETLIRTAEALSPEQKRDIQGLIDSLRHEWTQGSRNPERLSQALQGLRDALGTFEATHPGLTLAVNGISTYFANLGI